jgi:hypothetical protein
MARPEGEIAATARRLARACRHVVQACLREEEWADADEEFERVILAGIQELEASRERNGKDAGGGCAKPPPDRDDDFCSS